MISMLSAKAWVYYEPKEEKSEPESYNHPDNGKEV